MKLGSEDIPKLQYSLLALVFLILLGTVCVLFSRDYLWGAQTGFSTAQRELGGIDGKLRQVRSEEDEIRHKSAIFNALAARNMIGSEQRLDWVELLRELRDKHHLIELRYEFSPQHALEMRPAGNLNLYASTMRLQLGLLHEEDLTRLLEGLRREALALIQIRRCDVSRLSGTGTHNPVTARLQADCMIDWITLNEVNRS